MYKLLVTSCYSYLKTMKSSLPLWSLFGNLVYQFLYDTKATKTQSFLGDENRVKWMKLYNGCEVNSLKVKLKFGV